jgi:uncharacterized membrane protein
LIVVPTEWSQSPQQLLGKDRRCKLAIATCCLHYTWLCQTLNTRLGKSPRYQSQYLIVVLTAWSQSPQQSLGMDRRCKLAIATCCLHYTWLYQTLNTRLGKSQRYQSQYLIVVLTAWSQPPPQLLGKDRRCKLATPTSRPNNRWLFLSLNTQLRK